MSLAGYLTNVDSPQNDMGSSPSLLRVTPDRRDEVGNVLLLLGTHAAMGSFWLAAFLVPIGPWLVCLAPAACVLHQKAMSEWLHEATHWNFLSSRTWNDRACQVLAGLVLLEDVEEHRRRHFLHHKDGASAGHELAVRDGAHARRDLLSGLVRDLVGVTAMAAIVDGIRLALSRRTLATRRTTRVVLSGMLAYATFGLALANLFPETGWTALAVYLGTLATFHPALERIRTHVLHAEDTNRDSLDGLDASSSELGPFGRLFVSSKPLRHHRRHLESPTLPYRQLARIDRLLTAQSLAPEPVQRAGRHLPARR